MFSETLPLNICICQPDLSDWCHLYTNSSTAPVLLELVSRKLAKMFYCSLNYACFHICCWISSWVIYDLPFWTWTGTVFQSYKLSNCPSSLTAYLSQDIKQTLWMQLLETSWNCYPLANEEINGCKLLVWTLLTRVPCGHFYWHFSHFLFKLFIDFN